MANPEIVIGKSEGKYGEPVENRIIRVPNSGKLPGYDLITDQGGWIAVFAPSKNLANLPGPLFIESSARFNGRPACFFDSMNAEAYLEHLDARFNMNALLSITGNPRDQSTFFKTFYGYRQPFDVAVLHRAHGEPFPNTQSAIDTFEPEGGPSIVRLPGESNKSYWGMLTGFEFHGHKYGRTPIEMSEDMTILFVARFYEDKSFLELNWRDSSGVLQTSRTHTVMANNGNFTNFFLGATGSGYTSAVALKMGTWTEAEIDQLRSWAAEYLPPVGKLPQEP